MASGQTQLLNLLTTKILTGGRQTTAQKVREMLDELLDSYLNNVDGGFEVQSVAGYSTTAITLTDSRAFVHKAYADSLIAPVYTAGTGINLTANQFSLGDLTQNTTIGGATGTYYLRLGSSANKLSALFTSTVNGSQSIADDGAGNTSMITQAATSIVLTQQSGSNSTQLNLHSTGLIVNSNYASFAGMQENQDYSANYSSLSLINKGYAQATFEPVYASSTTAKYWRGDKTWQTLDTSVVPENGSLYFTTARVLATALAGLSITGASISSSDTVIQAFGKLQNQINGLLGGVIYKGTYNATTNTPTLIDGTGTAGWYYVVNVAGNQNFGSGVINFNIGDWVVYNGTIWQKVDNTDAVSDVNGAIGSVSLTGTSNRITVTSNVWDIASTYVGQTSITTLGTIVTGTWNASVLGAAYGGTGVANNAASTITISGNFGTTITVSNTTAITLPTSGTLYGTKTGSITSAQLLNSLSDPTGTGVAVFSASPAFTGNPTAPTQSVGDNSTRIATTAYVDGSIGDANDLMTITYLIYQSNR